MLSPASSFQTRSASCTGPLPNTCSRCASDGGRRPHWPALGLLSWRWRSIRRRHRRHRCRMERGEAGALLARLRRDRARRPPRERAMRRHQTRNRNPPSLLTELPPPRHALRRTSRRARLLHRKHPTHLPHPTSLPHPSHPPPLLPELRRASPSHLMQEENRRLEHRRPVRGQPAGDSPDAPRAGGVGGAPTSERTIEPLGRSPRSAMSAPAVAAARAQAEAAIGRGEIPPGFRKYVRDYFTAIQRSPPTK